MVVRTIGVGWYQETLCSSLPLAVQVTLRRRSLARARQSSFGSYFGQVYPGRMTVLSGAPSLLGCITFLVVRWQQAPRLLKASLASICRQSSNMNMVPSPIVKGIGISQRREGSKNCLGEGSSGTWCPSVLFQQCGQIA